MSFGDSTAGIAINLFTNYNSAQLLRVLVKHPNDKDYQFEQEEGSEPFSLDAPAAKRLAALALRNKVERDPTAHAKIAKTLKELVENKQLDEFARGHCLESLSLLSYYQPEMRPQVATLALELASNPKTPLMVRVAALDHPRLSSHTYGEAIPLLKKLEEYSTAGKLKQWWWKKRGKTGEAELAPLASKLASALNGKWGSQLKSKKALAGGENFGRLVKTPIPPRAPYSRKIEYFTH